MITPGPSSWGSNGFRHKNRRDDACRKRDIDGCGHHCFLACYCVCPIYYTDHNTGTLIVGGLFSLLAAVLRGSAGWGWSKIRKTEYKQESWPACYCKLLHVVAEKLSIELFVCSSFGLVIRLKLTRLAARFAYPQFLLSSPQTAVTDQFFVTPSALHVITFDMGYPHQTILQPITRLRLFLSYMCEGHSGTKTSLSC